MLDLLSPQSRLDTRLLQRPGGWAWWYLDLVDEKGDMIEEARKIFRGVPFSKLSAGLLQSSTPCVLFRRLPPTLFMYTSHSISGGATKSRWRPSPGSL